MSNHTISNYSLIQPSITTKTIKSLLHAIRHNQTLPDTPISQLRILRQSIPNTVPKPVYDHLLIEWFANLILSKVNHLRDIHRLKPIIRNASEEVALAQMQEDFLVRDLRLQAWSILYYDFIRVDISLNGELWEQKTLLSGRTVRRRRTRAYYLLLTEILIQEIGNQSGQYSN